MSKGDIDRTLWVGNISDQVTEELLYELFLQVRYWDISPSTFRTCFVRTKGGSDLDFTIILMKFTITVHKTIPFHSLKIMPYYFM